MRVSDSPGEFEGAEVTMVADGLDARAAWSKGTFELVVLDAMLPGMVRMLRRFLSGSGSV